MVPVMLKFVAHPNKHICVGIRNMSFLAEKAGKTLLRVYLDYKLWLSDS